MTRTASDPILIAERGVENRVSTNSSWRQGRTAFPVKIGVTGHRDPADREAVRSGVREHLGAIQALFPTAPTTPVRFTILSSLAEGADRLVVAEAIDLFGRNDVDLHAVLPLAPDDYLEDFEESESKHEFHTLLENAAIRTRMRETDDREEAYERAGRWIVEHCDVLIALWDGHQPSGRGGTAEICCYARYRGVPLLIVPTLRNGHPDRTPRDAGSSAKLPTDLSSAKEAYQRFKQLNRSSVDDEPLATQLAKLEAVLESAADGSGIHWIYRNVAEWAVPRLSRADVLAVRYQHLYYRLGEALYGLAALAVAAVAAQAMADVSALFALFEVAFMLILLVMFWTSRRAKIHGRWVGYRSLAEAFRSALFIHLTGADARVDATNTGDLSAVEDPWFQRAFSQAWRQRPSVALRSSDVPDLRQFLIDAWIADQVSYQRGVAVRFGRARIRLTRIIVGLFALTFIIGILHSLELVPSWKHVFVFLAIALPSFGAALTGIRDQRQYRLHEDRARRTASRLEVLRRNMGAQMTLEDVQKLAAQVQAVIEAENLDWWGVIEFQDLEMVI